MHQKLIQEGKTAPLTFKELRKLERLDMRKEEKIRRLELWKEGVSAAGQIGRGIMEGPVTGPIALTLLLSATYPEWTPIAAQAVNALASAVFNAWRGVGPPGLGGGPPLTIPPTPPGQSMKKGPAAPFCIKIYSGALTGGWKEYCWASESDRNGAYITALATGANVILEDPKTT